MSLNIRTMNINEPYAIKENTPPTYSIKLMHYLDNSIVVAKRHALTEGYNCEMIDSCVRSSKVHYA